MQAAQHGPDLRRQPNLPQAPGQTLTRPVGALHRRAARNRDQYHASTESRGKVSVTYCLQPDPGSVVGQPSTVRRLQPRAQQPAVLANRPAPARQVGEARCKRQGRKESIPCARIKPPALIRKNRPRVPACRAPARSLLDRARHRALARSPQRADFPPPLPEGSATRRRPAHESHPWRAADPSRVLARHWFAPDFRDISASPELPAADEHPCPAGRQFPTAPPAPRERCLRDRPRHAACRPISSRLPAARSARSSPSSQRLAAGAALESPRQFRCVHLFFQLRRQPTATAVAAPDRCPAPRGSGDRPEPRCSPPAEPHWPIAPIAP